MKAINIGLFLIVLFVPDCNRIPKPVPSTFVVVINSSGAPVPGAEVFQDGVLKGTTDGTGRFAFSPQLATGTKLFARSLVYTQPSYRPDHGPGSGWVMHVYQTSRVVNLNGSVTDLTVGSPKATQTLTVSPNNTLIGWHLVVSLNWDASAAEFVQLTARFKAASQYLYNLTDGQFVIEEVELADDYKFWSTAEITFHVDSYIAPNTSYPGGFLYAVGNFPHVEMAPFSPNDFGSMLPETIVHELGHLAFGLADEYAGVNAFALNYCTDASHFNTGRTADFNSNKPLAACFMDHQNVTHKMCSAHADSLHRNGNWQPGPCWHTVAAAYGDPGPGGQFGTGAVFKDRWIVTTPDLRGVVGTLPKLPPGWEPKINPTNKPYPGLLCQPVTVSGGAAAAGGTVWVHPQAWRNFDYTVGRLDSTGKLVVRGVHNGDVIQSPFATLPFTCVITQ